MTALVKHAILYVARAGMNVINHCYITIMMPILGHLDVCVPLKASRSHSQIIRFLLSPILYVFIGPGLRYIDRISVTQPPIDGLLNFISWRKRGPILPFYHISLTLTKRYTSIRGLAPIFMASNLFQILTEPNSGNVQHRPGAIFKYSKYFLVKKRF